MDSELLFSCVVGMKAFFVPSGAGEQVQVAHRRGERLLAPLRGLLLWLEERGSAHVPRHVEYTIFARSSSRIRPVARKVYLTVEESNLMMQRRRTRQHTRVLLLALGGLGRRHS